MDYFSSNSFHKMWVLTSWTSLPADKSCKSRPSSTRSTMPALSASRRPTAVSWVSRANFGSTHRKRERGNWKSPSTTAKFLTTYKFWAAGDVWSTSHRNKPNLTPSTSNSMGSRFKAVLSSAKSPTRVSFFEKKNGINSFLVLAD